MPEPVSRRALWSQKLAKEVVRGITERIENGTLGPGAPLGTRDEIAVEFVTSNSVVDKAVEELRESGLITEDENHVLHVAETPPPVSSFAIPVELSEQLEDLTHVLELRIGIEAQSAELAARRHDEAALKAVRDAAAAFESAVEQGVGSSQADYRFHLAIAAASGNPYIHDILDHLGPLLIPRMRIDMPKAEPDDAYLRRTVEEHKSILDAITAGQADAARIAMHQHLTRTFESMRQLHRQTREM